MLQCKITCKGDILIEIDPLQTFFSGIMIFMISIKINEIYLHIIFITIKKRNGYNITSINFICNFLDILQYESSIPPFYGNIKKVIHSLDLFIINIRKKSEYMYIYDYINHLCFCILTFLE